MFKEYVHIFVHIEVINQGFEEFSNKVIEEISNEVINLIYGFHELYTIKL
jgi:hypothetical protein